MKKITLSWYIKVIRINSKNIKKSYQSILTELFSIIFYDLKSYYVESTTSSRIMNQEYDVPYLIREKYNTFNDYEKKKISDEFISKMIDKSSMDNIVKDIKDYIRLTNISNDLKKTLLNENNNLILLSNILSIVLISDNRVKFNKVIYKNNNASIELIIGDIIALGFNKKLAITNRIVVIPVEDKFTMQIDDINKDNIISKDSIHGKWLLRLNKLGIQKLNIKYVNVCKNIKIGKCQIGKTMFYLLPISTLKERYKAESNIEMIKKALNALSFEYSISGQGITMYIPLIGTGRSRVNLKEEDSIKLIKDSFINKKNGFFGNVKIVIYSKNIDFMEDL